MSRRVLVTGGASGLGAALVERFVARGDRVLVTDLADAHDVPGADYRGLDVTSDADWEAAREHVERTWGGLDVLVNNAGIAAGGRIDVASIAEWQRVLDINVLGVARGCATFVPVLKAGEGGAIVNVASMAGLVHPPGMASYNAAKAAVVALSETLGHELAPWGITVSAVCPSFFRTNLASSLAGKDEMLNDIAERLINRARLGVDEIADRVMAGIEAERPVIVTDRAGWQAYLGKRFATPLYTRTMRRMGAKIRAGAEREATRG